ncbi:MAG: antibiotic biosynthesis monooxygenase family protein [Microbacteriaceae bacterium]
MIAAQFIFQPGSYDAEFHALDAKIEDAAAAMPGFLGTDKWYSKDGTRTNSIYYFESMADLTKLGRVTEHRDAKGKVSRWYDGFQVVVTEVVASYGDGNIPHISSGFSKS